LGDFPVGFGRYELVERLAIGGMAEVFLATAPGEHGFQKKVVIKRLLPHLVADETYNAMFIDEAKLTARLVHPKIAQTFELGKVDNALFIAMEYIDGIDVLALLREYAARKRRIEPQLAAWVAHEVLDALDYAHNMSGEDGKAYGVVHRDISPSNILLSMRGDIKLVDFGIARARDPERAHKSKSGTLKGKYGYMSPEQVLEQPLDARSDLFSIGVVLAELLTGRRLFAAANELDVLLMVRDAKLVRLDKYGADLDPGLDAIVRKALKKPLDDRWQSAAVFRDAIAEWLFEQRHRMTNKHVAETVASLHEVVLDRRRKSAEDSPTTAVVTAHGSAGRRDVLDDIPVPIDGPELSQPLITYERPLEDKLQRALDAVQPIAPLESARIVRSEMPRPVTTPPPMRAQASTQQKLQVISERVRMDSPTRGMQPLKRPAAGSHPPEDESAAAAFEGLELSLDGAVEGELAIASTISAAVSAITLPEHDDGSIDLSMDDDLGGELTLDPREDSGLRSFDDLTSEPIRKSKKNEFPMPSAEEVARKRPPTPPALADIAEPPDDSGDFSTTSPLRVLFRLMTARATGLLVVFIGGIKKEIYVRDGQPEYVSSNVASELFGNYLVSKNVLSDGELAMALAMMPHYGGKLGDTLVGLGLLKPLEVFRHLTRQVRTKIIDVCTWNKGQFGWYAGRENPREAFPLDFNAFEILGAGAMNVADDVIESWVAKHGSLRLRVARTRRVGPERFEVKGLVEMCETLDGRRAIADIVEAHPDRPERLRSARMLNLLEACDLARPM